MAKRQNRIKDLREKLSTTERTKTENERENYIK